ncbi:hypothetical protein SUGI_0125590 [Cryptomeria japonica]|nr:hypothetical protein SUGI_0125590 [Cryptomeria japonica]
MDVFWAIRGGGGGSFGVVLAWQIRLVKVPPKVTVFNVNRVGSDNVTRLVQRWQEFAPYAHKNLFVRAVVFGGKPEVKVTLNGMFLGSLHKFVKLVNKGFPEMGLVAGDCKETDWIGGMIYTAVNNGYSADFRNRFLPTKSYFKIKSDFVTSPISASGLAGAWKIMEEQPNSIMILAPLGGIMDQIPSYQLPFPHREGYLYDIQYVVTWDNAANDNQSMAWIRKFYDYMAPHVSKSPRAAYVNYIDLDLGTNPGNNGGVSMRQAKSWGERYFGGNFERLVHVKSKFDPSNIFRNARSIPALPYE